MLDEQTKKVKIEIAIKMMVWGILGIIINLFNTININEHLISKNIPIFIFMIFIIIIISVITIYSIHTENKYINPYEYYSGLIFDQLIDFTISSYGLIWIILFMMSIVHKQPLFTILSFGVAYAWWKLFCYTKIVFIITQLPNQSVLTFLGKSKVKFFRTVNGATFLILSLTVIGIAYMIMGYYNQ